MLPSQWLWGIVIIYSFHRLDNWGSGALLGEGILQTLEITQRLQLSWLIPLRVERGATWVCPLPFFLVPVCVKRATVASELVSPKVTMAFWSCPSSLLPQRMQEISPQGKKIQILWRNPLDSCPSSLVRGPIVVSLGISLQIFFWTFTYTYTHLYKYSIDLHDILVCVPSKAKTLRQRSRGKLLVWEVIPGNSCRGTQKWKRNYKLWFSKMVTRHIYPICPGSYDMPMFLPQEAGICAPSP